MRIKIELDVLVDAEAWAEEYGIDDADSQAIVDDVRQWVRNAVSNHPEGLLANDLSVMLR